MTTDPPERSDPTARELLGARKALQSANFTAIGSAPEAATMKVGPPTTPKNAPIPREIVNTLSADIEQNQRKHMGRLRYLTQDQRELLAYLNRNMRRPHVEERTAEVGRYMTGAVLRIFDLVGGTLRAVRAADIDAAERHVQACLSTPIPNDDGSHASESLLPFSRSFARKARRFHRVQEHVLDEMLYVMFEKPDEASQISNVEKAKVYLLLWIAVHAIDAAWTAP